MRTFSLVIGLTLLVQTGLFAQNYQGPASGSISGGVVVNTDNWPIAPPEIPGPPQEIPNRPEVQLLPPPSGLPAPLGPESYNAALYFPESTSPPQGVPPIELASFAGIPETNSFPPDPHMAVGPDHVILTVNTSFRIIDKQGNLIKQIAAASWFSSTLSGASPFDPQVIYDHHNSRWIMVWDQVDFGAALAYYLISVSDDENAEGIWYNWALPAHLNGSTPSGNWADFPQIGFDQDGLYITSREFSFPGFYQYPKLRIVGTNQLYQNNAGPVTWTDIWAISDVSGLIHDGLRPSKVYSDPDEYFLMMSSSFGGTNTYFILYRLSDPLGTPSLSAVHVPVAAWVPAPNARQLGGGVTVEAGGSAIRHAVIYRDSTIWAAHSVGNGAYSSIRYVKISTLTNTALEDARLGATGYWHFYPALMVDGDDNVLITFSRSSDEEYIGAGLMWRHADDPVGLQPTHMFKDGEAHYEQVGSGRNRWGDYMGVDIDPAEPQDFWMLTEYAGSPDDTWATWVYSARLSAYPNQTAYPVPASHDFGRLEVGTGADTLAFSIFNAGEADLQVTSVSNSAGDYTLVGLPSFPVTLGSFESIDLEVVFDPLTGGDAIDSIVVESDDPASPSISVPLNGRGVVIGAAQTGVLYSSSGPTDGQLFSINRSTGAATLIGDLGINELQGLAINPMNQEIIGIQTNVDGSTLYRVSAGQGDAMSSVAVDVPNMRAIAFSEDGTLYGGATAGGLYTIDPSTGSDTFVGTATGVSYSGLSFSPTSGMLWGSVRGVIGRDRIYTVNTANGDTTYVGKTGDNQDTPYIAFEADGRLYGLKGVYPQENTLISIDTLTAVGTLIGNTGVEGLTAMTMRPDSLVVSVETAGIDELPASFGLSQNYPNPFNPTTEIVFDLPEQSMVRLTVYNILGQEVRTLVDGMISAGRHRVAWDATNNAGRAMASGIYVYRMEATGDETGQYTSMKKMVLLR